MTYTNDQLKKAFYHLLDDCQNDIDDAIEHDPYNGYCERYCPIGKPLGNDEPCPACAEEESLFDEKICREQILKWYVENSK